MSFVIQGLKIARNGFWEMVKVPTKGKNMQKTLGQIYWQELESEITSTKKCLERFNMELYEYKPTEKSMKMGHLALTVSDIPNWIALAVKDPFIDLSSYRPAEPKSTEELVAHFEQTIGKAKEALLNVSDEALQESFSLKMGEQVLSTSSKLETVMSSINHLVHHRGQLTVYMRLNNIAIPKIYGPSGDEQGF